MEGFTRKRQLWGPMSIQKNLSHNALAQNESSLRMILWFPLKKDTDSTEHRRAEVSVVH